MNSIPEKPFPYTIDAPLLIYQIDDDTYEMLMEEENDEICRGYLVLCQEGCGMTNILVVNSGDETTYGTMWFLIYRMILALHLFSSQVRKNPCIFRLDRILDRFHITGRR